MDTTKTGFDDLKQIRTIMERSSTFLSLSGFSGIVVGLIGILAGFIISMQSKGFLLTPEVLEKVNSNTGFRTLIIFVLIGALVLAVLSAFLFSLQKSKRKSLPIFNKVSLSFASHFFIPLVTGGLFIAVLAFKGYYDLILPAMLVFYGLSLVSAAKYTLPEIVFLGFCSLGLGLVASFFVAYSLILWVTGFGVCTIVYGLILYSKYDK